MRSRLNKRKRDSSPDSLQPSRRRTPSNLLVAESPDRPKSSVDSSPDSPPPGKMVLSFLNSIHWPVHMDITLFEVLKRARAQEDEYIGLSWNDDKMWDRIHSELREKALVTFHLDEIKDRVQSYKSSFRRCADNMLCRENSRLRILVAHAFEKPMDAGPITVPQYRSLTRSRSPSPSRSQSRTTTHSGQLSDGVSTGRGGGEYNTSMSELKKMRGPNPTDLTSEEYYWAVNYFNTEHRSPIFFELDVQDRLPYIKRFAAK